MLGNSIQVFKSNEFGELRTFVDDLNEPWFIAKDVCDVLGLGNVSQALNGLDDDEKSQVNPNIISSDVWHGRAPMAISEPGFYSLVLKSRKQEAKAFKRWVTHEVIPSIRKHGAYATPEVIAKAFQDPAAMAQVFAALAEEQGKRKALEERNRRLEVKAGFYDSAMEAKRGYSVTEAARYMGQVDKSMCRKRLFELLEEDGIITKDRQAAKAGVERGYVFNYFPPAYVDPETMEQKQRKPYAKVTQKGLDWMLRRYCTVHEEVQEG